MTLPTQYVLHGILNSSTFISQISRAVLSPGMEYLVGHPAGLPVPMFCANIGTTPTLSFESSQLATLLGLTGASLVTLAAANTDLHFKEVVNLSNRQADATAEHLRFRMAQAALSVDRITLGHRSEGTASCRIIPIWNGSLDPVVPAGTLALAGTPTSTTHYLAGPVSLNGTLLTGVQEITIDYNRQIRMNGGEGQQYITACWEESIQPVVTIKALNVPWTVLGLNGLALTAYIVYARRLGTTGVVSDGTTTNLIWTGTTGLVSIDDTAAGGNAPGETTIRITGTVASAASTPLIYSVGAIV